MSLDAVLEILRERGLRILVNPEGRPSLIGPRTEITDALREAVTAYRDEILERFKPRPRREFLFPAGEIASACGHLTDTDYPVGAWYWRWHGESDWWPIPGKTWSGKLNEAQKHHAANPPTGV